MQALDAKYRALYEPLYAQRKDVVLGADGGIPGFWGTVIEHHHLMQEEVTEKDQGVLRHLQDVAWEPIAEEGKEGFKIKFFFEEDNPYFDNAVLEKAYIMKADEDDVLEEAIGTEIAWKKGKNVTVKVIKKKVKKKGKESGPPLTKTVNHFKPYLELWGMASDFMTKRDVWLTGSFKKLLRTVVHGSPRECTATHRQPPRKTAAHGSPRTR